MTNSTSELLSTLNGTVAAAGTTQYIVLGTSRIVASTTEQNRKVRYYTAGTLRRLSIKVDVNTADGDSIVTVRKNGGDGNISVTIPAGRTGTFENTNTQDTVAVNDDLNYKLVVGGSTGEFGGVGFTQFRILFDTGKPNLAVTKIVNNADSLNTLAVDFESRFLSLTGQMAIGQTNEDLEKIKIRFSATAKNMYAYVSANTRGEDTTVTLKQNSIPTSLAVTFPAAGGAGLQANTSTVTLSIGDDVNWAVDTQGGGGSITFEVISVEIHSTSGCFVMPATIVGSYAPLEGTTTYWGIGGILTPDPGDPTIESSVQLNPRIRCTITSLGCRVSDGANSIGANSTLLLRVNGVDTAISITIGALLTGYFEDTAHSVVVNPDDLICYKLTTDAVGDGSSISFRSMTSTAANNELQAYPRGVNSFRKSGKAVMGGFGLS